MRGKSRLRTELVGGVAIGAALMYWLDPANGRRRRGLLRDRIIHARSELAEGARITALDLGHRASGLVAAANSLKQDTRCSDEVLVERVRSKLGRLCSHPHAVDATARDGTVELRGIVLASELRQVISGVSGVHGVRNVTSQLEAYETPEGVPALQGGATRKGHRFELLQENWSPAARFVGGMIGGGLVAYGLSHIKEPTGIAACAIGSAFGARAATNLPMKRLLGIGIGSRAIEVQKTMHVNAPVEEVFAFWRASESFPRFMTHVREARPIGHRRFQWCVGAGPLQFTWCAEATRIDEPNLIEWATVGSSLVKSSGQVRFDEEADGSTRVHIRLMYSPPFGALGHAVAKLLGADPKKLMDDDLLRFKSLIETGTATGLGDPVHRDDIDLGFTQVPEAIH